MMEKKYGLLWIKVNFIGARATAKSLRKIADYFGDQKLIDQVEAVIAEEMLQVEKALEDIRPRTEGKRAMLFVGGSRAHHYQELFAELGMETLSAGYEFAHRDDYEGRKVLPTIKVDSDSRNIEELEVHPDPEKYSPRKSPEEMERLKGEGMRQRAFQDELRQAQPGRIGQPAGLRLLRLPGGPLSDCRRPPSDSRPHRVHRLYLGYPGGALVRTGTAQAELFHGSPGKGRDLRRGKEALPRPDRPHRNPPAEGRLRRPVPPGGPGGRVGHQPLQHQYSGGVQHRRRGLDHPGLLPAHGGRGGFHHDRRRPGRRRQAVPRRGPQRGTVLRRHDLFGGDDEGKIRHPLYPRLLFRTRRPVQGPLRRGGPFFGPSGDHGADPGDRPERNQPHLSGAPRDPEGACRTPGGHLRWRRGAFKAFSLIKALRYLGMDVVLAGSQTGNDADYEMLRDMCDDGTVILDDANPLELSKYILEKKADLFIGGVKERPIAYKMGIGFCNHNHERKIPLAGYAGMLNFAREVHATVTSPVWQFVPKRPQARIKD